MKCVVVLNEYVTKRKIYKRNEVVNMYSTSLITVM